MGRERERHKVETWGVENRTKREIETRGHVKKNEKWEEEVEDEEDEEDEDGGGAGVCFPLCSGVCVCVTERDRERKIV